MWWLFMTYLDNEVLKNVKRIYEAFRELVVNTFTGSLP